MTQKQSAGILLYRIQDRRVEVLLVHPGGPFWKNKDDGAWTIPKGEIESGEDALLTAKREFTEETGVELQGPFTALTPIRQKAGKQVMAWAVQGDLDTNAIKSNHFEMEWPPRSGKQQSFPEIDRAAWYDLPTAGVKINAGQVSLLEELVSLVG